MLPTAILYASGELGFLGKDQNTPLGSAHGTAPALLALGRVIVAPVNVSTWKHNGSMVRSRQASNIPEKMLPQNGF